eukprot:scaffold378_cov419-Prasinococcus_capsulatus_cf.AAC.3
MHAHSSGCGQHGGRTTAAVQAEAGSRTHFCFLMCHSRAGRQHRHSARAGTGLACQATGIFAEAVGESLWVLACTDCCCA